MSVSNRAGWSLACCILFVAGCGRDEIAPRESGQRALETLQAIPQTPTIGGRLVADPGRIGLNVGDFEPVASLRSIDPRPLPSLPIVPSAPPPTVIEEPRTLEVALLRWDLTVDSMQSLLGETLVYPHPENGEVYRGSFDRWGLEVVEQLDGDDGFVRLARTGQFLVNAQRSDYPMQFWAPDRGALIEVLDCEVDAGEGQFDCRADEDAQVAIYYLSVVTDPADMPEKLWCVDGCPNPERDPQAPWFERQTSFVPVADQIVLYAVEREYGLLTYDGDALLPEEGQNIVSGALFEPTEANLEALACDLDGDGVEKETCVWGPLEVFYSYAVNADDVLPYRGPGIVSSEASF